MTMRLRIAGRGLYTPDFVPYVFGGQNWRHLLYDFNLDATNTPYTADEEVGTTTSTERELIGSISYLYPFLQKHTQLIDGTVRGNVKIKYKISNGSYTAYIERMAISLQAINTDGVLRTIQTYSVEIDLSTQSTSDVPVSIPLFFDINSDNAKSSNKIESNERMVIKIAIYGKVDNVYGTGTFKLSATINQDDVYINIPIV